MKPLLVAVLLTGMVDFHGTKFQTPSVPRVDSRGQPRCPVLVVADGTPGRQRQEANGILNELNAQLSPTHPLLVAWFDGYRPATWVADQTGDIGDSAEADLRHWASALENEECFGSTT